MNIPADQMLEVLKQHSLPRITKFQSRGLPQFVAENIPSLIHSALFSPEVLVRSNAVKIISANNVTILKAITENDELRSVAHSFISGTIGADESVFGSFCQIIESCVTELPGEMEDSFPFLIDFLTFCESESVYRLFENLIKLSDTQLFVEEFFRSHQLVQHIIRFINDKLDDISIHQLYKLLILCTKTAAFQDDCFSPATLQFVRDSLNDIEGPIQAMQWKLLTELLKEETVSVLASACPKAISLLCTDNLKSIHQWHVEALSFATSVFSLDADTVNSVDNDQLIGHLTKWFEMFPTHTIALEAVCQFMETAVIIPMLLNIVTRSFIPVIISATNRIQIAFAIRWARSVWSMIQSDDIDLLDQVDFLAFCKSVVAESDRILKQEYGKEPFVAKVPVSLRPALNFDSATINA